MSELFHQIFTAANVLFMLKGLGMSIAIALLSTIISIFFGTILALARTYATGHFKWVAALISAYTEFFRWSSCRSSVRSPSWRWRDSVST